MSPLLPSPDDDAYPWHARPEDHNVLGLFVLGPEGMTCALAALIAESLLRVSGSTFDGMRRAQVRDRADYLRRTYTLDALQAREVARRQMRSGHPFFPRPAKPANSGRKRRAAA